MYRGDSELLETVREGISTMQTAEGRVKEELYFQSCFPLLKLLDGAVALTSLDYESCRQICSLSNLEGKFIFTGSGP